MASVSTSHLILFIASMVVAAGVAGTFTSTVSDVTAAMEDQSLDVSEQIRTDVEVISDPAAGVYDDGAGNVTVLVKNTGSTDIAADPAVVDVLVDGVYRTNVTLTVVDGGTWGEHDVVRLAVSTGTLDPGDHRLKLIVNGDEEVFRFRV